MALTLQELIEVPTDDEMLARLLKHLQGIGFTRKSGFSPGKITLEGTPTSEFGAKIQIAADGSVGTATYQYSVDGGVSFSSATTIPSNGTDSLGGTGLSILFSDGPVGSGDSFIAGDIFSIDVRRSTLPVTSWQPGATARTLVENDAVALVDLWSLVQAIASGGLLLDAEGPWLDLLAEQFYERTRAPGITAQGYIRLDDLGGGGPFSIGINQLWVTTAGAKRFNNTAAFTLPKNGFVVVPVQAESPGASWNVGVGEINQLVTVLPGVTVSNPIYANGTWKTQSGSDDESDSSLVSRCLARWPALSQGATAQVYDAWAREANPSVTRTKISASNTQEGTVNVVLADVDGPVDGSDVSAVNAYLLSRKPLTESVNVQSAAGVAVPVTATLYVRSGFEASVALQASENLNRLFRETEIDGTLYRNNIIEELSTPQGLRNVVLTSPASDVVLSGNQVATLIATLTYQTV